MLLSSGVSHTRFSCNVEGLDGNLSYHSSVEIMDDNLVSCLSAVNFCFASRRDFGSSARYFLKLLNASFQPASYPDRSALI